MNIKYISYVDFM